MDLDQLGSALGKFFDGEDRMHGPSHDEITRAIVRTGLTKGDPRAEDPTVGKMKQVREVLAHATDHAPADGLRFALRLVGCFGQPTDSRSTVPHSSGRSASVAQAGLSRTSATQ